MANITWGDLRTQVRRSLLLDTTIDEETGAFKWSNDQLADFCGWALDTFAQHTAVASATSYPATTLTYNLPNNLLTSEPFDINGAVFITDGTLACVPNYLDPIKYSDALRPDRSVGFYAFPEGTLNLTLPQAPGDGFTVNVHYFAFYPHPVNDSDPITVPQWARAAISYLISAHALSSKGLTTANIRQFGSKPDTGAPGDNPIQKQQAWFLQLYEKELALHTPQDRINSWRASDR